jgi:predicted short-subunit dehydrogenase-like oxidoreductase (DUF2520 family)
LLTKQSRIIIIGAGKIAYSLTAALIKSGYNVSSVISKNKTSAEKLAKKFKISFSSDKIKSLKKESQVFFLTVPDNQIEKIAKTLSKLDLDFQNSLFVHVSGALDISELKSLKKKKAGVASFHVMQTFPSTKVIDIANCSVAIEAEQKTVKDFLNKLAFDLYLKPFLLNPCNKIYYHLAGVFASNFLVGNLFSSEKMFQLSKKGKANFNDIINSIVYSTINNVKETGTSKALSGPIERGDYETIEKHLKALKKKDKQLYKNYIIQSLNLLEVVKEKNGKLNKEQKRIKSLLLSLS